MSNKESIFKLLEIIKKYGKRRIPDKVFNSIQNWAELLISNIAFLNNLISQTFYYCDYFSLNGMEDRNYENMKDNLVQLHLYGLYTFNGHSNKCGRMTYEGFKMQQMFFRQEGVKTSLGEIIDETNYSRVELRQRSYLNFYCDVEMSRFLLDKMKDSRRVYYLIIYPDEKIEKNTHDGKVAFQQKVFEDFPRDRIDVGDIPKLDDPSLIDCGYCWAPDNIKEIMKDKIFFMILAKDMGGEEVTDILLEMLKDRDKILEDISFV